MDDQPGEQDATGRRTRAADNGVGTGFLAADGVAATYSRAAGETVAVNPYHITATLSATGLLTNYAITNVRRELHD